MNECGNIIIDGNDVKKEQNFDQKKIKRFDIEGNNFCKKECGTKRQYVWVCWF